MSKEEFTRWIRIRLERESLWSIARSLGVSDVCVLHWSRGARQPLGPVLRLADYLTLGGIDLAPGLPLPGEKRDTRKRRKRSLPPLEL
jgi:hypothetical protein